MKQRISFILVFMLFPMLAFAQFEEEMKEFDAFVKQQQQEFSDFVEEQNKEFSDFLKQHWMEFDSEAPVARPKKPEPVNPVLFDKNKPLGKPQETPVSEVAKLPVPIVQPSPALPTVGGGDRKTPTPVIAGGTVPVAKPGQKPVERPTTRPVVTPPATQPTVTDKPVVRPETKPEDSISLEDFMAGRRPTTQPPATVPEKKPETTPPTTQPVTRPTTTPPVTTPPATTPPPATTVPANRPAPGRTNGIKIEFYGETCYIDPALKNAFTLNSIDEKDVSKAWETLCRGNHYKTLINDCISIKNQYALNDWGYLLLAKHVAEVLCGRNRTNEVAFMQMFILCQSGYKTKVARSNNKLILLYTSDCMIYATTYLTLQGTRYFLFNHRASGGAPIYTYNKDFGNSTRLISMSITPNQALNGTIKNRTLKAKRYPVTVNSDVNTGLINFYKDYPQCEFSVYVQAPVSKEVQQSVLPPLKRAIQGKSEAEAANILINFVQTAFEYQTDDQQFGYEKPFFVDELFYYPYSDCEDRSVLYSYLVRTLLGLDVVLLDYPNHIATAVRFNDRVDGDYVMVGNTKYTICDPTYIGATIGNAMPQYKNVSVKVLKY